jgi:pyruvate/2-oxoglutarate dehydrogenase complex dihydrolipoamide dehydrogenase (E3) component
MVGETVDVIVVGMGVAGEAIAAATAEAGLQVIGIDARLVGGECAYWGCIPTKIIVRGPGRLTATDTVEVDGRSFRATRALVIASGTSPVVPDIPGLDDVPFWTNRDAVETPSPDIAAADILGRPTPPASYHAVPRVTFTDPEVGAVGMTEKQARDNGRNVRCVTTDVAKSSRGFVHGDDNRGLIKLVIDAESDTLIGATSVGPMGGEVLSMLTLAVHVRLTTDTLRQMIYAYPTFHRAILDALGRL